MDRSLNQDQSACAEDRPLRVLYVEYGAGFGGAAISLAEIVANADAMNVEPCVLTFQRPDIHEALFGETRSWVHQRAIDYRSRASLGSYMTRSEWWRWLRWCVMKGYAFLDYLHELYLSWVIFRLARRERVDLIHSNNGLERSALRGASWADVKCIAHLREVVGRRAAATFRRHRRLIATTFGGAIAVSSGVYEAGLRHGLQPEQMVVIHNPVNPGAFRAAVGRRAEIRRAIGLENGDVAFGCFGRVNRFKGQKEFLAAAAVVAQKAPAARFVIVGDQSDFEDEDYWEEIQAMAAAPPLDGRVVFAGYQEDVHAYFHACDAVVHSALGAEGFGRVVVEGMACEKPVIATDIGGPRDIVTHGVDGFLVPPGAVENLGAAMLRLAVEPSLRARMGKAGRAKVDALFSSRSIASQVGEFYAEVMASAHQPRPIPS